MTVLRSGSASDVGRVRAVNEDLALESMTLFAVADGMGGHAGGEVAAHTAIESLQQEFARQPTVQGLVAAVRRANRAVWERAHADADLRGMGTTLTAAALVATDDGDRLVLANVGDSRSYRFHQGELTQLTRDHSVAEELVDRGELSEAEAAVHPHRHILTRALGVAPEVDVDVWQVSPEAGDRYLLCSDGLTNELTTRRITNVLSSTSDPQEASETLVRMANEHGGNDNVTVVVLDVVVSDEHADGAAPAEVTALPDVGSSGAPPPPLLPPPPVGERAAGGATGGGAGATAASPAPADEDAAADDAVRRSLLGRFGAEGPARDRRSPEGRADRLRTRRVTVRVLLFLVVLAALAVGAVAVVRWYVNSSYFVQMHRGQVVVFQGRRGGFLGVQPHPVWHTGIPADQIVEQPKLDQLNHGVEEPSLRAACNYVVQLTNEEHALQQAQAAATTTTTTAPPPAATASSVPPSSVPTAPPPTTTTTTLPKACRGA